MLTGLSCPCSSHAAHVVGPILAWMVLVAIVAATLLAGLRAHRRRRHREHESR